MNNKEKYRDFCKTEKNIPIFSKDWWLDSVCPDNKTWDVVLVEKGGQIVASMPYVIGKSHGFNTISMPQLTQNMGPYIKYPDNQKYDTKLSYEKEIMNELIAGLPKCASFCQNFNYRITNWLPFYWNGYKQTTRYTYVLENISDVDTIWNNMAGNTRNEIKKAQKIVEVKQINDVDDFYRINSMTFERQNIRIPYSLSFLKNLDYVLEKQNARNIYFAFDKKNKQCHAAIYVVRDEFSAYYLMGGANPDLRNSQASSLLIWEAIKETSLKLQKFDFEGSMLPKVEPFFRSFGAIQHPYFQISKINEPLYNFLYCAKEFARATMNLFRKKC